MYIYYDLHLISATPCLGDVSLVYRKIMKTYIHARTYTYTLLLAFCTLIVLQFSNVKKCIYISYDKIMKRVITLHIFVILICKFLLKGGSTLGTFQ